MSMFHPKTVKFDRRMKELFDEIDDYLEVKYGERYPLHPNRPSRGSTSNKANDGLFNIGVQFSAGFGSEFGRGYVVDFRISTLTSVPDEERERFLEEISDQIRERLPVFFPNKTMRVVRDGGVYKIIGDFSLGYVSHSS